MLRWQVLFPYLHHISNIRGSAGMQASESGTAAVGKMKGKRKNLTAPVVNLKKESTPQKPSEESEEIEPSYVPAFASPPPTGRAASYSSNKAAAQSSIAASAASADIFSKLLELSVATEKRKSQQAEDGKAFACHDIDAYS